MTFRLDGHRLSPLTFNGNPVAASGDLIVLDTINLNRISQHKRERRLTLALCLYPGTTLWRMTTRTRLTTLTATTPLTILRTTVRETSKL
jgi:hypothetical protein